MGIALEVAALRLQRTFLPLQETFITRDRNDGSALGNPAMSGINFTLPAFVHVFLPFIFLAEISYVFSWLKQ